MSRKPLIIPIFVPNLGCPHRCVFCNQSSITGREKGMVSRQKVAETVSRFLGYKGNRSGFVEIAFYGGNFLGLSEAHRGALLDAAQGFVEKGHVGGIRFSTRPETITHDNLNALAPYTVSTVELGAQSMDDEVLLLSQRGHTAQDTRDAVARLRVQGMRVGLQIMPGLPGDATASILETGRRVAALKPDSVRIYPTVVVKNTVLERWYHAGRFTPLSLTDAVELSKSLYVLFRAEGIEVIRMGLQATESLSPSRDLVAGPYHPAFGHLVHGAVFLEKATQALEREERPLGKVTLRVHPRDVPRARGLKNQNVTALKRRFDLKALEIMADPGVAEETLRVEARSNGVME